MIQRSCMRYLHRCRLHGVAVDDLWVRHCIALVGGDQRALRALNHVNQGKRCPGHGVWSARRCREIAPGRRWRRWNRACTSNDHELV